MAAIDILPFKPISIGAGAVFHYSEKLLEACQRKSRFDEPYSMARVIGTPGSIQRIWVPRNMVTKGGMDLRVDGIPIKFNSKFKPRNSEQSRVINEAVKLLKTGSSFVAEAPTGFGKTWCAMHIIAEIGKKTIIVVTKEDIRDQWIAAAEALLGLSVGKGIGLIQGDQCSTGGAHIVIAMIQSLSKEARYPEHVFKDFGFAIWDECHRVGADIFSQSAYRIPAKLRMGISATPDRKDGKEEVIIAHIGPVRVRTEVAPMPAKIIRQPSPWDCPRVRKKLKGSDEYTTVPMPHTAMQCKHVVKIMINHHGRNKMIAEFVAAAYKKDRKVLVQSDFKEHLETLLMLIAKQGVPQSEIGWYIGGMKTAARDHSKTKAVILATYQMTAEATDIPELDTLVMASPKSDVRQIVGRIRRFLPDKKMPTVFDLTDNSSPVFEGFAKARLAWYRDQGFEVGGIMRRIPKASV